MEVQCLLLLEVLGGSHRHAVDGAVKKLSKLWKEVTGRGWVVGIVAFVLPPLPRDVPASCFPLQNPGLVEQYLSAVLSLEPNQNYAGMLGLLVQFCTSHKEMDVVNRHKAGGLAGGEDGELVFLGGPQLLASSEACWCSHMGAWPCSMIGEV